MPSGPGVCTAAGYICDINVKRIHPEVIPIMTGSLSSGFVFVAILSPKLITALRIQKSA